MSKLKVGNKNYSADVMGDAYEFLIKKFADLSKKNAGEFYTPRSIVGSDKLYTTYNRTEVIR